MRIVGLGADYYGRLLLCLATGGAMALAAALGLRRVRPQVLSGLLVWTAGLLVFTAGLYLFVLAGRQPIPAPLPPGYVPR